MKSSNSPLVWTVTESHAPSSSTVITLIFFATILSIIAFALIQNSPIMAVTFVLLGTVVFLQSRKPPKNISYSISDEGVLIEKNEYPFENIESFWILYKPEEQALFLKTRGAMIASVRIPLGDMSPNSVREALLKNVREVKYEPTLIDTLSRFLHI